MNKLILSNGNIFDGYKFIGCKDILIEEGKIVEIDDQISLNCCRIDLSLQTIFMSFIPQMYS